MAAPSSAGPEESGRRPAELARPRAAGEGGPGPGVPLTVLPQARGWRSRGDPGAVRFDRAGGAGRGCSVLSVSSDELRGVGPWSAR